MPLVTVELRRIVRKEVSQKSAEESFRSLFYVRTVVCIVKIRGEGRSCCGSGVGLGSIAAGSRPQARMQHRVPTASREVILAERVKCWKIA